MIVDYLRSCYSTTMRLDPSDPTRLTKVDWYFTEPDAQVFPGPCFASRNYIDERDRSAPLLGEVRGAKRPWRNGSSPSVWYMGRGYCGPLAAYSEGTTGPTPARDNAGAPICCRPEIDRVGGTYWRGHASSNTSETFGLVAGAGGEREGGAALMTGGGLVAGAGGEAEGGAAALHGGSAVSGAGGEAEGGAAALHGGSAVSGAGGEAEGGAATLTPFTPPVAGATCATAGHVVHGTTYTGTTAGAGIDWWVYVGLPAATYTVTLTALAGHMALLTGDTGTCAALVFAFSCSTITSPVSYTHGGGDLIVQINGAPPSTTYSFSVV